MNLLSRLAYGILKTALVYLVLAVISILVSTSLITGKFPPSWQQIKGLKKSFEALMSLTKQNGGKDGSQGGLNSMMILQQQLQKMAQANNAQLGPAGSGVPAGTNGNTAISGAGPASTGAAAAEAESLDDPEMKDIKNLMQHHEKQAAISRALTGEKELPSKVPQGGGVESSHSDAERIRRLEDLVRSLHGHVQRLNQQVMELQRQGVAAPPRRR